MEQNGGPQLSCFPQGLWSLILGFRRLCWLIVFLTRVRSRLLSSIRRYNFRCYFLFPASFTSKEMGLSRLACCFPPPEMCFLHVSLLIFLLTVWKLIIRFLKIFTYYRLKTESQKLSSFLRDLRAHPVVVLCRSKVTVAGVSF